MSIVYQGLQHNSYCHAVQWDAYTARGSYRQENGFYREGYEDFKIAVQLNPNHASTWSGLGTASMYMEHVDPTG